MFLHFLIKTEATWLPQLPICFFPAAQWPSPSQIQHALCLLAASKRPRHHAAPCGSMMHKLSLWIAFQCDFSSCLKIFQDFFQFLQDSSRCFTTVPRKSANLPQPSGPPGHLRLSAVARLVGRIGLRDRPID